MVSEGKSGDGDLGAVSAVRLAELQKDVGYAAAGVARLEAAFDKFVDEQRAEFADLRELVARQAQSQAVSAATARQWQETHEKQHEQEHTDQSRKGLISDVIAAVVAAGLGILIQPGRAP